MSVTITWNEAAKIAKKLQKKYQLPIFAMTYQGSCSCCAAPCDLNKQAYLTPEVKEQPWDDIDSYIILKNSSNSSGEARMKDEFSFTDDDLNFQSRKQYVQYRLSENFTKKQFEECLTEFVNQINKQSGKQFKLILPQDERTCAIIEPV